MPDFATSSHPAVQAQLDRLGPVTAHGDRLGLERIAELCERLGRPQDLLPPVFHVAGTNGKGSTCAFLRAGLEAGGHRAHVFTSPHLVRFNERIRLAGRLIANEPLAALLEEVIDAGEGIDASFFEVTTAAALLAFARTPADACIVEVGLGGRLDATNVIERPLMCAIASLGLDHQQFLGCDLTSVGREKAGIAKRGVPLVTLDYPAAVADAVAAAAAAAGACVFPAPRRWRFEARDEQLHYRDDAGALAVPLPALEGAHQAANCALAIAMLRHQGVLDVPLAALRRMPLEARWPGRLERLEAGPVVAAAGGAAVWVDGGHNPDAALRVADWLAEREPRPLAVVGLLANKDARGFLAPIAAAGCAVVAVPVPGHECHSPAELARLARSLGAAARTAPGFLEAVTDAGAREIAILGSLYLAGAVLAANDQLLD